MSGKTGDPREHVHAWIDYERRTHADVKYGEGTQQRENLIADVQNNPHMAPSVKDIDFDLFIGNYMSRVKLHGLDTPQGRQAMGKAIITMLHALETAVLVHGPMPRPGMPSGNITEWEGDTHA